MSATVSLSGAGPGADRVFEESLRLAGGHEALDGLNPLPFAHNLLVVPPRRDDRLQKADRLVLVLLRQLRQRHYLDHGGHTADLDELGEETLPTGCSDENGHRLQLRRHRVSERVAQAQPRGDARQQQRRPVLQLVLKLRAGHVGAPRNEIIQLPHARDARARIP